ncbi:MAG: hypothetical protein RL685_3800 [Pseudomonadota bacterium]
MRLPPFARAVGARPTHHERSEPSFPWQALPADRPIACCSLGTQTHRHAQTVELLQQVVDVFSAREDYFLVLACNSYHRQRLRCSSPHVLLVERAPQLALLRKASLALTHALTPARLDAAVTEVTNSTAITGACARMKDCFETWQREPHALRFVERLLEGRAERTTAA